MTPDLINRVKTFRKDIKLSFEISTAKTDFMTQFGLILETMLENMCFAPIHSKLDYVTSLKMFVE